jgi:paraquat-inducible protein A
MTTDPRLGSCHCCGLIQTLPAVPAGYSAVCHRCGSALRSNPLRQGRNRLTAALALAALAFYPPALMLPLLHIERLGHVSESSLLAGIAALWAAGHWLIGLIILVFSIVLPPAKLITLWLLSTSALSARHRHRAVIYHAVEFLGRWSMLDVLLVAVLVAFVKLGDVLIIEAGRGVIAFALMVLLSLAVSLAFDPWVLWQAENNER